MYFFIIHNNNLISQLIVFIVGDWSTIKIVVAALAMANRHKLPCSHNTGSKMVLLYGDLLTGGVGWGHRGGSRSSPNQPVKPQRALCDGGASFGVIP